MFTYLFQSKINIFSMKTFFVALIGRFFFLVKNGDIIFQICQGKCVNCFGKKKSSSRLGPDLQLIDFNIYFLKTDTLV